MDYEVEGVRHWQKKTWTDVEKTVGPDNWTRRIYYAPYR